jgi:hypothetical protein
MPSGAREGSARCTIALNEPLRNEPQMVRTFKFAMTIFRLLLGRDQIDEDPDSLNVNLADVSRFHPDRVGLARMADAGGGTGKYDVARLQREAPA